MIKKFIKDTKARIIPYTVMIMLIMVAVSGIFLNYGEVVKADLISNIITTPGAVNCVVSFTCNDASDSVQIYYGEHSIITTSDNATYVDPDECTYGNRLNRKMIIRGLDEKTHYYYRLYSVDDSGWCAAEDSFVTLPRFTNRSNYKDNFYDDYQIESYTSSIDFNVYPGEKTGILIQNGTELYNSGGYWHIYLSIVNGTYHMYGMTTANVAFRDPQLKNETSHWVSTDGLTWNSLDYDRVFISPRPRCVEPFFIYEDGLWYGLYVNSGEGVFPGGGYFNWSTSANPGGPFVTQGTIFTEADVDSAFGNPSNDECIIDGTYTDYLGANRFSSHGQVLHGDPNRRYMGHYVGFNLTDWMTMGQILDIPRIGGDQVYYLPAMVDRSCGIYVGVNQRFENDGPEESIYNNETYLAISRNGVNWTNVNTSVDLIPNGTAGSWDRYLTYPGHGVDSLIINIGDKDYMYYAGCDGGHGLDEKVGRAGAVYWRKDGLSSITINSDDQWFRTTEIDRWFGANLTINGNFSNVCKLNVSVLNASTNLPFEGYDFADFDTIVTNSTSIVCSWGGESILKIPDCNFKLNFSFDGTGGELFSYTLLGGYMCFNDVVSDGDGRVFTWGRLSDSTKYQLQIANDSSFNDIFYNADDINSTNYASQYYNEVGSYVNFNITNIYNEGARRGDTHYYRVRAYVGD